jgi:MFS family permease
MTIAAMSARRRTPKPLQVAAAVIGNALEWYDFICFGLMTVIISRLFFPAGSQYASLLLTTATFGVGFFMRPVGGIVLGIYADRSGRKSAMLLVVGLMTVAIAMLAFAPTYAAIGMVAPLIIVLARLLQGFSAGGEFGSSTSFLIESAPPHRRGLYGSWQMVGQGLSVLMGTLLGALLTRGLSPESLDSWGWRVPFLFGLLIGPVGLYIRRHLDEPEIFLQERTTMTAKPGLGTTLAAHLRELSVCSGLVGALTISFYVLLLYMPTFANTQLHLPLDQAFIAQSLGLVCLIVLTPLSGALSDHVGRRPIMIGTLFIYLVITYPLFRWVQESPSFARFAIMQSLLCGVVGVIVGPLSTAIAEQFPTGVRSTCLSVGYNLPVMIFGGFAQFFVTWLIEATGSPIAPAFYLMFGAAGGLLAAFYLVEHARDVPLPALAALTPSIKPA